jgi:hypothetical protein
LGWKDVTTVLDGVIARDGASRCGRRGVGIVTHA